MCRARVCAHECWFLLRLGAEAPRKLKLEGVVSHPMWELGTELESHARLVHYFSHWTISPALVVLFDLTFPWLVIFIHRSPESQKQMKLEESLQPHGTKMNRSCLFWTPVHRAQEASVFEASPLRRLTQGLGLRTLLFLFAWAETGFRPNSSPG